MDVKSRSPLVAVLLSLLCIGLGALYLGRWRVTVLLRAVPLILMMSAFSLFALTAPRLLVPAAWVVFLGYLALWIGQAVWSWSACRATPAVPIRWWSGGGAIAGFIAFAWLVEPQIGNIVRDSVVEPFRSQQGAMAPTLLPGDQFFIVKRGPHATIERGAVVVFPNPLDESKDFVKRVVALEGDEVEVGAEGLRINGALLERGPCAEEKLLVDDYEGSVEISCRLERSVDGADYETGHLEGRTARSFGPTTVPPGHVFVLGDNRDNSSDSRIFGPVPVATVKGRARVIWLSIQDDVASSWSRIGLKL